MTSTIGPRPDATVPGQDPASAGAGGRAAFGVTLDEPRAVLAGTSTVLAGSVVWRPEGAGGSDGPVRVRVEDGARRLVLSGEAERSGDRWWFDVPGSLPADDYTVDVVARATADGSGGADVAAAAGGVLHVVGVAGVTTAVTDEAADEVLVELRAVYHGPDGANVLVESPWDGGLVYEDLHDGDAVSAPLHTHCSRVDTGEIPVDLWVTLDGYRHHVSGSLPHDGAAVVHADREPDLFAYAPPRIVLDGATVADGTVTVDATVTVGTHGRGPVEAWLVPAQDAWRSVTARPAAGSTPYGTTDRGGAVSEMAAGDVVPTVSSSWTATFSNVPAGAYEVFVGVADTTDGPAGVAEAGPAVVSVPPHPPHRDHRHVLGAVGGALVALRAGRTGRGGRVRHTS